MTGKALPLLFTIEGSSRHDVILLDTTLAEPLNSIISSIESLLPTSPNAAEFMGKYRSKDQRDSIAKVHVKWSMEGRDKAIWPRETLITEENSEAVWEMLKVGVGKDVLDVKLKPQAKKEGEGEGK